MDPENEQVFQQQKNKQKVVDFASVKIKKEPDEHYVSAIEANILKNIKSEIKTEPKEENGLKSPKLEVKKDIEDFFSELSKMTNIKEEESVEEPETPVKKEIKTELCFDDSNPSPFNKELFKNFCLQSPLVSNDSNSPKVGSRKSVKRTVFQRESPYKRFSNEESDSNSRLKVSIKDRLGARVEDSFE